MAFARRRAYEESWEPGMRDFILGRFLAMLLLAVALLGVAPAAADQLASFASAAPAAGSAPGFGIRGYLSKPKGNGPFPAVILLHSCLGLPSNRQAIGAMLAGWGYVALFVDDFSTRRLNNTCAVDFPEGIADAYGGLAYVAALPFVDRTRIAAIGFSQGGDTALKIAAGHYAPAFALPRGVAFAAAAALYAPCGNNPTAHLLLPTLILIGDADTVTPATDCERLAGNQPGSNVKLIVYPGAHHVFDDPAFAGGRQFMGMWLQYDKDAAAQSRVALRGFLATTLTR